VIVLALLNAIVRPMLYLFSFPLIMFTLGIFMVIINAVLLHLTAWLVTGFTVDGFWPSVWGALLISVIKFRAACSRHPYRIAGEERLRKNQQPGAPFRALLQEPQHFLRRRRFIEKNRRCLHRCYSHQHLLFSHQ